MGCNLPGGVMPLTYFGPWPSNGFAAVTGKNCHFKAGIEGTNFPTMSSVVYHSRWQGFTGQCRPGLNRLVIKLVGKANDPCLSALGVLVHPNLWQGQWTAGLNVY